MDDLTPDKARRINQSPNSPIQVPEVKGILVARVVANSPAARAGIRLGDVITAIDGKSITTGEQLLNIVENSGVGQNLQLKVRRGTRTQQLSLRTADMKDFS